MDYEYINLLDYLNGKCHLKGCIYNDHGHCTCEDEEFLANRLEDTKDAIRLNVINTKKDFACHEVKPKENTCLYCGSQLKKYFETYEVWGARSLHEYWGCPRGC